MLYNVYFYYLARRRRENYTRYKSMGRNILMKQRTFLIVNRKSLSCASVPYKEREKTLRRGSSRYCYMLFQPVSLHFSSDILCSKNKHYLYSSLFCLLKLNILRYGLDASSGRDRTRVTKTEKPIHSNSAFRSQQTNAVQFNSCRAAFGKSVLYKGIASLYLKVEGTKKALLVFQQAAAMKLISWGQVHLHIVLVQLN